MRRTLVPVIVALASVAVGALPVHAAESRGEGAKVVSDASLSRVPLRGFGTGPATIADDHRVMLGGIGSDLYPSGRPGEYWMVTDRGPNGQVEVDGAKRRTFPTPGFTPTILRVRVDGGKLTVVRTIPLRDRRGKPITGLSNQKGHDEKPYTWDARRGLSYDPGGLDTEGLLRSADGSFWLTDEYSPSLVHVAVDGRIIARYVPHGLGLVGAGYPVVESLPGVLLDRAINRGIESVALAPDGRRLYVAMQSPLALPDEDAGEKSRNDRVLAFDTRSKRVVGEYVYRFEDVRDFDPGADGDESEMKVSAMVALDAHRLLIDERTDDVTKLYVADLRKATDVLGTDADDPSATPPLEQTDLSAAGITPLAKRLALDLTTVPGAPTKIEGLAVPDPHTVVVANDNDFGMTDGSEAFDEHGRLNDSDVPSRVVTLRLPRAL